MSLRILIEYGVPGDAIPDFAFIDDATGIISIGGVSLFYTWEHFATWWPYREKGFEQKFGSLDDFEALLPDEWDFRVGTPEPNPDGPISDTLGTEEAGNG